MKSIKGEISNNFLAFLVIAAIALELAALMIMPAKITGNAGNTGTLSGVLGETTGINFTNDTINFGTISVPGLVPSCQVDTESQSNCTGDSAPANGFVIENTGNKDVILLLATGKDAQGLLGGTTPGYQWKVSDKQAGSCTGAANAYVDVNKTSPGTEICSNFSAPQIRDEIYIDVKLVVPSDATPGAVTDTFTATATAIV
jgi:hypothetical protein